MWWLVVKQDRTNRIGMFTFQIPDEEAGLQIEGNGDEMDDITNYVTFHICTNIKKNRNCSAFHVGE